MPLCESGSQRGARLTTSGAPQEAAAIAFDGRGETTIRVGKQSNGQDHVTSLFRLAAERLWLDPDAFMFAEGTAGDEVERGRAGGGKLRAPEPVRPDLTRRGLVLSHGHGVLVKNVPDTGNRADYAGLAALTLHPTFAAMAHKMACRRFVVGGPEVKATRAMLDARADTTAADDSLTLRNRQA